MFEKLCSLSIVILFILTSFVTVYAYDLVPQEATDTEGLYSEMSFEYHSQEATGEIISIASDNTSLIYILKRITGEKSRLTFITKMEYIVLVYYLKQVEPVD